MLDPIQLATLAASPIILSGLVYAWWAHPHARFTTVAPGRLFHSAAMSPHKLVRVARLRKLDVVIDFRSGQDPAVAAESDALSAAGIRHIHLPTGISPQPPEIAAFVQTARREVVAGRRVLMHCEDGEGRAVMFAAIYRIEFEAWSPEAAYLGTARLPDGLRFLKALSPRIGCLSPRNVKSEIILRYRPSFAESSLHINREAA